MQVYLYARSGHTVGLEQTKRCAAFANALKEFDPILCTSDFRAGAFAKDLFGIRRYVNVDVLRNLHNMMNKNDILLFESQEANKEMIEGMKEYCSLTFNLEDIKEAIIDTSIYTKQENPTLNKTIFFGDDDYNNQFLGLINKDSNKYAINLLMGHYFFLGNEKEFSEHFENIIDEEEYVETIQNSKFLLTASLQTALESLSCGNKPVLFKREDKTYDEGLIKTINLPIISENNLENLLNSFEEICENYPKINTIEFASFDEIKIKIKEKIELFNKLTQ